MNDFEKTILAIYKDNGNEWLNQLPTLVTGYAKQWGLSDLYLLSNLSHNYILSGFRDKQPIILKLGMDYEALANEAMALEQFSDYGVVKVLDKDIGALLIQQAIPGTSLKEFSEIDDYSKIRICCELTAKLHHTQLKLNYAFPKMSDWLKTLDQEWELPKQYLILARKLRDKLLTSTEPQILLHGDLHHDNILKHGDKWLIIDPKG
ncbi:MAG: aminoglycoside phosphotransferase family protein, partial [Burkholderiales bacterium]